MMGVHVTSRCEPMSAVTNAPKGATNDYHIVVTEDELDALRDAVEDADGRKSEVKKARDVLGLY